MERGVEHPIIYIRCVSTKYGDSLLATIEDTAMWTSSILYIYLKGIPMVSHRGVGSVCTTVWVRFTETRKNKQHSWILWDIMIS